MPHATQRVPSSVVEYSDHRVYRVPEAVPATYFGGAMVCLKADGTVTKAANTTGLKFDGILEQTVRQTVTAEDTVASMSLDQSKKLPVLRPFRFRMYMSETLSGADVGKLVYAEFDNEVTLTPGNGVIVGTIDQVVGPNDALILPHYHGKGSA